MKAGEPPMASFFVAFPYVQFSRFDTMQEMFIYRGKVRQGAKRGRDLGFPTANILLHKKIPEGIYASEVFVKGKKYFAATFVGKAETFHEKDYKSESFLLDFSDNLYGKWITVRLHKNLRGNKKFAHAKDLIQQMQEDIVQTKKFFKL